MDHGHDPFPHYNAQQQIGMFGQNVIMWGVLTDGEDTAYQNQSSASCSPAVLCDSQCGFQPIRVTKIGITRLTHVFWKCFVCPKNVNLPISIWLHSKQMTNCLHFENEIDTDIYEWE